MSRGTLVPPGPMLLAQRNRTLAEYAPVFLKWLSFVRQRRENTVRSYGEDLKTFFLFAEQAGLSKPDDVNFRHLEFFLGWLQKERGLKASSANRHMHALRTFWVWMVREEITTRNPAAQVFLLATQKKLPNYLSIAEQEKALATLAARTDLLGGRDYALVATGQLTGLRCSELSNLELAHLDLDAGVVRVVNGKGMKDRELPVIPRLEAILRSYLEQVRRPLVGRPRGGICMSRCLAPSGCALDYESSRIGPRFSIPQIECEAKCRDAGESGPSFGAIAYSRSTGAVGWSYSLGLERVANASALVNCARHLP